jgi:hypothetical protein
MKQMLFISTIFFSFSANADFVYMQEDSRGKSVKVFSESESTIIND